MKNLEWDELFGWSLTEKAWSLSSQKRLGLFLFGLACFPISYLVSKILPDVLIVKILIQTYFSVISFELGRRYLKDFTIHWKSFYEFILHKDSLISFLFISMLLVCSTFCLDFLLSGFPSGIFKLFIIGPVIFLISLFFRVWGVLTLILIVDDKGKNLKKNMRLAGEVISQNLIGFFILLLIKTVIILLGIMSLGVGFFFLLPVLLILPALLVNKVKNSTVPTEIKSE